MGCGVCIFWSCAWHVVGGCRFLVAARGVQRRMRGGMGWRRAGGMFGILDSNEIGVQVCLGAGLGVNNWV